MPIIQRTPSNPDGINVSGLSTFAPGGINTAQDDQSFASRNVARFEAAAVKSELKYVGI